MTKYCSNCQTGVMPIGDDKHCPVCQEELTITIKVKWANNQLTALESVDSSGNNTFTINTDDSNE